MISHASYPTGERVSYHKSILGDFVPPPCVYGWFRNKYYLYIGQTVSLHTRLSGHHAIGRKAPIYTKDELHLWLCGEPNLNTIEVLLVLQHTPPLNADNFPVKGCLIDLNLDNKRPPDKIFPFQPVCGFCKQPYIPDARGRRRDFCCYHCFVGEPKPFQYLAE